MMINVHLETSFGAVWSAVLWSHSCKLVKVIICKLSNFLAEHEHIPAGKILLYKCQNKVQSTAFVGYPRYIKLWYYTCYMLFYEVQREKTLPQLQTMKNGSSGTKYIVHFFLIHQVLRHVRRMKYTSISNIPELPTMKLDQRYIVSLSTNTRNT